MEHQRIPFHKGLRGKMLLYTILPISILLITINGLTLSKLFSVLRADNEELLAMRVKNIADEVEKENLEAITTVKVMALAEENGLFGKREESKAFARQVLDEFPQFTGAYFGYEPNADQDDQQYLSSVGNRVEGLGPSGRFIPYWFRDHKDNTTIRINPLEDMETSLYYDGVRKKFLSGSEEKYMVTEPYVYEGKMIVEQTFPITKGGKFVGIAGVDVALGDLDTFFDDLKSRWDAEILAISRLGKIISATSDAGLKTRPVGETVYADIVDDVMRQDGRPVAWTDPVTGEALFLAGTRVPTGDWKIILQVPQSKVMTPIWRSLTNAILLSVIGGAVTIALLVYVANSVTRGINDAVAASMQVATGDLAVRLPERTTDDETGLLLTTVGEMAKSLAAVVGKVKEATVRLTSTATELSAASREQDRTISSFGESTSRISAAVNEITATSQELFHTVSQVTDAANGTAGLADEGRVGIERMGTAMGQLVEATRSVSSKLGVIRDKAERIDVVVTTISKVSEQTNMLSVNAAIEAEKAGVHGTGFLVVSREIRRMADQTAVATLDIERMVQEMRAAVSAGVMEMDKFTVTVREGVDEIERISHQLEQIISQVHDVSGRIESVNEGMSAQSRGATDIRDAMHQLTDGAKQSAASLAEVQKAGRHVQAAVESLRGTVARFKVST
ncbi:Methyl-accepting chemotaxis protein PctC [Planctomycetes bacterium Pan216]|uniref:Methyl-accepting chemotaxis protein PctC n=2 Tax=Kolteria novifilia TaxID=2527975 RepID=A0A518B8J7_9BACT|nr:Methyl-accepting chemotaxis protein PctC [Planctomycetes bacterium Pan216]